MQQEDGPRRVAGPRRSRSKYVAAIVILMIGIAVLAGGVYRVATKASAPAALAAAEVSTSRMPAKISAAPSPDASLPSTSLPAQPSPETSKTVEPSSSATPVVAPDDVEISTDRDTGDLTCWIDNCWIWYATADAPCASAEAEVEVFRKGEDDPYRTATQSVGGFTADQRRVVEVENTGDHSDQATVTVTCKKVDDGI